MISVRKHFLLQTLPLLVCVWRSRLVQCSGPGISAVPISVPADTFRLRLEKTRISRVPRAAFYNLSELRFLWLTYNSIMSIHPSSFVNLKALRELRLEGNLLASFPWEGLRDMPRLQTFSLHNNRLSVLPAHASLVLPNVTYLDLSSNRFVLILFMGEYVIKSLQPHSKRADCKLDVGGELTESCF